MDGVIVLDKPSGISSFEAVRRVRRHLDTRKAGHLGTLDPLASGVLVIFLGRATRLIRYCDALDKSYQAELAFGKRSESYDRTGTVTETEQPPPDASDLKLSLQGFLGAQWQQQPAFSALKVRGKRAYERARAGEKLDLGKRQVIIHQLELLSYKPPMASLSVRCSSGTYIRSLIHELGEKLGCGAMMTELRRTAVGPFTLSHAVSLEELSADSLIEPREIIHHFIDWKGRAQGDRDLLIRQFDHSSMSDPT